MNNADVPIIAIIKATPMATNRRRERVLSLDILRLTCSNEPVATMDFTDQRCSRLYCKARERVKYASAIQQYAYTVVDKGSLIETKSAENAAGMMNDGVVITVSRILTEPAKTAMRSFREMVERIAM